MTHTLFGFPIYWRWSSMVWGTVIKYKIKPGWHVAQVAIFLKPKKHDITWVLSLCIR